MERREKRNNIDPVKGKDLEEANRSKMRTDGPLPMFFYSTEYLYV
jgi:hypothetical protein